MTSEASTFGVLDYLSLVVTLCISTSIGLYFACRGGKQKTTEEYFMADRDLPSFPVAMSLLASYMSAISYLGIPSEVYTYGTMWCWFSVSHVIAIWITTTMVMPVFYKLRLVSVHEYLERRFNKSVRLFGTMIFYVQKCLYLGVVVYAPCLVLSTVTGMSFEGSVFLVAVICTFYTTIGGLKAVVWTDVFQISVAFVGFNAIIIKGAVDFGGFSNIWLINEEGKRIEFWNFSPDPRTRHTVWSVTIGGLFIMLFNHATNQYQVQRYLSCRTLNTARWSLFLYGCGLVIVTILPCLAGVIIYAYYNKCDPKLAGKIERDDQIIAYLVVDIFRDLPGLPGIFVSSCFSAALSTMSSGLNSLAAVTGEDIIKSIWPNISEKRYTNVMKITVLIFGVLVTGLAFLVDLLGQISQTVLSFSGIFGGPLLGIFSLGLFFPRANTLGVTVGFFVSLVFGLWISISAFIYPTRNRWLLPVSTEGCIDDVTNITIIGSTTFPTYIEEVSSLETNATYEDLSFRSGIMGLYSLSYTWYSPVLCFMTILVGLLISIVSDRGHKQTVDPRLLSSFSDAFTWCLPKKWRQSKDVNQNSATRNSKYEIALSDDGEVVDEKANTHV